MPSRELLATWWLLLHVLQHAFSATEIDTSALRQLSANARLETCRLKPWSASEPVPTLAVQPAGKYGGVYQFEKKYGANVDGYSPIYTPDIWSESGEEYSLGTKGLLAWAGLIVVLLGVGINLILSTSQLGQ